MSGDGREKSLIRKEQSNLGGEGHKKRGRDPYFWKEHRIITPTRKKWGSEKKGFETEVWEEHRNQNH